MTSRNDLPVSPPSLVRNDDGTVAQFTMPAPLTRGGYRVEVFRAAPIHGFERGPYITLRGASPQERPWESTKAMEIQVEGHSDWVDDTDDTITVAVLQLAPLTTQLDEHRITILAYLGQPGVADYTDYDDRKAKPFSYHPQNPNPDGPEVADRFQLPKSPILVKVTLTPERAPLVQE